MKDLKEISLFEGEQIIHRIEGDAYNNDPNPVMKAIGKVLGVVHKVLGISQKVYFVQTTHRYLLVEKGMVLWKFPRDTRCTSLSKGSIESVGYTQARRWIVFKSLFFNLSLKSGMGKEIKFTGKLPELVNIANSVDSSLFSESTPQLKQTAA